MENELFEKTKVSKAYMTLALPVVLGLGECIIFGDSEAGTQGRGLHSALENVYEAIVAALYLDGGIDIAREWVMRTLGPHISRDIATEPESPKSSLQEYLQARRRKPTYRITDIIGPPHDRVFQAAVYCGDELIGTGEGHSKKAAEAAAAQQAPLGGTHPDRSFTGLYGRGRRVVWA